MTIICPTCQQFTRTRFLHAVLWIGGDGAAAETHRCTHCGEVTVLRAQEVRGHIARRGGGADDVVEGAGEVVVVERRAPKNWDERWAAVA